MYTYRGAQKLLLLLFCAAMCLCGCWHLHLLFLLAVLSQITVFTCRMEMLCFNMFMQFKDAAVLLCIAAVALCLSARK